MLSVLLSTTKESFSQHLPLCWKLFWGILRLILGYVLVFLKSCSILLYKFCTVEFSVTLTVNGLRKTLQHYLSAEEGGYFAVFFGLLWVYSIMPWETWDIMLSFLCFGHFWMFLVHFVICFWNGSQPSNIF